MEQLYPNLTLAGFVVQGYAVTLPNRYSRALSTDGEIAVDIPQFRAFDGLAIANLNRFNSPDGLSVLRADPSFHFPILTTKFFRDALYPDKHFESVVVQKHLGTVTHVSGAAARDHFGNVEQAIASLEARGELSEKGLALEMKGDLGEALKKDPETERLMRSSYDIRMLIPWESLRFILHDQRIFLSASHGSFQRRAAT